MLEIAESISGKNVNVPDEYSANYNESFSYPELQVLSLCWEYEILYMIFFI